MVGSVLSKCYIVSPHLDSGLGYFSYESDISEVYNIRVKAQAKYSTKAS